MLGVANGLCGQICSCRVEEVALSVDVTDMEVERATLVLYSGAPQAWQGMM